MNASFSAPRAKSLRARRGPREAFTLLEILLALSLVGLVLVSMNTFVFSMGELWGRKSDVRLFEQHVRAVTRYLEEELRTAAFPPAAQAGALPIVPKEIRPSTGMTENLLTFELPQGSRLFTWPDRPLPEVICSLQVRDRQGLCLLWHSRIEKRFNEDPPRETLITPLVTGMEYEYYDADFKTWKRETQLRRDSDDQDRYVTPQRLRLKFTHGQLTRDAVITLPAPPEALPNL